MRAGVLLPAALAAAAAAAPPRAALAPAAPAGRPPAKSSVPMQRVTASLQSVTLKEAAERLAPLLGIPISVPDRERPAKPGGSAGPSLDYDRRVSFEWTDLPLSDALRDFCRKFDCSLMRTYSGVLL